MTNTDTTTQTTQTLAEQLAPLAAELATVQEKINDLRDQESTLKAQILDLTHGDPATYGAGNVDVIVSQASRLNLAAIAKAYPATTHPQLYALTPDTKAVRHYLAEADLEPFLTRSAPSVKLS